MSSSLDSWITGYFPGQHVVKGKGEKGVPMATLTFGHVCAMERLLCFPPETAEDLVHCVNICGRPYKEALDYLYRWKDKYQNNYVEMVEEIVKDVDAWGDSFLRYYAAHSVSLPLLDVSGGEEGKKGVKKAGAPILALMRHSLISRLGYNPQTLDEAPFGTCLLDLQTMMEMDGTLEVEGEDIDYAKQAIEDALKKQEEEEKKEENKKE